MCIIALSGDMTSFAFLVSTMSSLMVVVPARFVAGCFIRWMMFSHSCLSAELPVR